VETLQSTARQQQAALEALLEAAWVGLVMMAALRAVAEVLMVSQEATFSSKL
jgi:hypothetical protein